MTPERAIDLISKFDVQVLVIGDVILDRFVWGTVNRFSPEAASCPILDGGHEQQILGGAGNVAANLGALGAKCIRLVGLIGHDSDGQELRWMISQGDCPIDDLLLRTLRKTTIKTRFVSQADSKHLLRFDREETGPCSATDQSILLSKIRQAIVNVSGIIIQDYGKGVLTRELIREIMGLAKERKIPVFVDPKMNHWEYFQGAELVTPNLKEAYAALGIHENGCTECTLEDAGKTLLHYTRAKAVIVTRGKDGMSLFEKGGVVWAEQAELDVVDVSGAGDTTIAMLALSRLAGASWLEAMELANAAAGIAVGKRGTSTVTAEELLSSIGEQNA